MEFSSERTSPFCVTDDQKTRLLPNSQTVQQPVRSLKRIVRINTCVIFFFAVLYVISYLRVIDMPRRLTSDLPLRFSKSESNRFTSTLSVQVSDVVVDTETTPSKPANMSTRGVLKTVVTSKPTSKIKVALKPLDLYYNESNLACKIPKLDPFDKSIRKYIEEEEELPKCHKMYPPVFKLGLNFTVVREKKTKDWKDCCYKEIFRSSKQNHKVDSTVEYSKKCVPMSGEVTEIPSDAEFIGVYCKIPERQRKALNISKESSSMELIDAFAFIPEKQVDTTSSTTTTTTSAYVPENDLEDERLNVVILGIDGTSRMNFMRIMPKVYKYLTRKLNAVSMDGYIKVGDNTFPNLAAALLAMNDTTVKHTCENDEFFDECPFIWKKFADAGYFTSYAEDTPWMGAFNYLKHGFQQPPVDYYLRPVASVLDKRLGSDERANTKVCSGPRMAIEVLLNYMQKLAFHMSERNQRYFQFIWSSSLTHDYLNQGQLGENVTLQTIKWFHKNGHLNNSVLILMSDHGLRYGSFRQTKQGKLEENLPFVYFVFPKWFREKYPLAIANLKKNTIRLTTPFDLHETLLDILNTTNIEEEEINKRTEVLNSLRQKDKIPRGISMFLQSPPERTCEMAEIKEHFCACHETKSLKTESSLAQQAANYAVFELNSYVSKFIECAFLSLKKVNSAFMFYAPQTSSNKTNDQVIKISFVSSPGDGEFEGTIVRHLLRNKTESWSLSDISRINLYGNQSHCITDKTIKKYCYCTDLLKRFQRK